MGKKKYIPHNSSELERYLNKNYKFRFNEITNRTSFKKRVKGQKFKLLSEYDSNSILRNVKNSETKGNGTDLDRLLKSDFVPKYNPFKDYFNNLPEWDGTDYIAKLAITVQTTSDEIFQWAFKKWIVSMVSCALNEGYTNHTMLILTGGQGIGKTTWIQKLIPPKLQEYLYSGNINPNNKDHNILLSEKLLINIDELASFNKKQLDAFKELLTKPKISERRAYGRHTEDYIRRASFIGSANHNEILMDVTGNRRFLCFETKEIDFRHGINLDFVYSQVMALLDDDNFKPYFSKDDIAKMEKHNKNFIQTSEEVEIIEQLFRVPNSPNDKITYLTATEIVNLIKQHTKLYNVSSVEVGKIMKAKGFSKRKNGGVNKYAVVKK